MRKDAYIGVDAGGTNINAAAVTAAGEIIGEITQRPSLAKTGTASQIIGQLADAINAAHEAAGSNEVLACGIGMPGPFDYEAGVSEMDHKFVPIKGLNLHHLLGNQVRLPMHFVNDGMAFGMGVAWRQIPTTEKAIALTIGTGLGSSYIEHGQARDGDLWQLPYSDDILEAVASGDAIKNTFAAKRGQELDPKAIEALARQGDPDALAAYYEMGKNLGLGLKSIVESFQPDKIVIGGKVARPFDLFGPIMEAVLLGEQPHESGSLVIPGSDELSILGAAKHAVETMRQRSAISS